MKFVQLGTQIKTRCEEKKFSILVFSIFCFIFYGL